jgi:hypothetical protein
MSGAWTHGICTNCWACTKGERVSKDVWNIPQPTRVIPEDPRGWEPYRCCFCHRWTTAYIYARKDPQLTRCRGKHGDAE